MSKAALLSKVSAAFGHYSAEATRLARAGRTADARWYAKIARSDFRELCRLAGLTAPAAHRTADSFAA